MRGQGLKKVRNIIGRFKPKPSTYLGSVAAAFGTAPVEVSFRAAALRAPDCIAAKKLVCFAWTRTPFRRGVDVAADSDSAPARAAEEVVPDAEVGDGGTLRAPGEAAEGVVEPGRAVAARELPALLADEMEPRLDAVLLPSDAATVEELEADFVP